MSTRAKKSAKPPSEFRRLTKAEALKLGVSYTAKRKVDKNLRRITKSTKLYTDREVAELKIRELTGGKIKTREQLAKTRVSESETKLGGRVIHHKSLTKPQLMKILRRYKGKKALMTMLAYQTGEGSDKTGELRWTTGPSQVDVDSLLTKQGFDGYLRESHILGKPQRYGVFIWL